MNKFVIPAEKSFLVYLLKAYYRGTKDYFNSFVDYPTMQNAVTLFEITFSNEDKVKNTNHLEMITKIFSDDTISGKNCGSKLGISNKTFYRYKQRYLQVFRSFLLMA